MLKLDLKTEPYWISLPSDVKLKVKPITSAIMSAAQTTSKIALGIMEESNSVDDAIRSGLGEVLLIKALARLAIIEWQGVMLADGVTLAPIEGRTIDLLMDIWQIAQNFFRQYIMQLQMLELEGNVLAPAANGTSVAEAHTAGSAE